MRNNATNVNLKVFALPSGKDYKRKILEPQTYITFLFHNFNHFLNTELSMHNQFIELRGQLVLGRSQEISTIMQYVEDGAISDGPSAEGLAPLMVLGSSGSGKSALMARCTLEIKKLGLPLFLHFVGAGPGSTNPVKLVEKLVQWLKSLSVAGL